MSALGDRIRELRLAEGLSQRELARRVEVGFPHISKIESGTEPASNDLIRKIAETLGADSDGLLLLAERVPEESARIVIEKRELALQFLRRWKDGTISDEDVRGLVEKGQDRT